jgi:aminopeptidase N
MFEQWAGATRFRDGVRSYLREFSYRNTETEDLWRHLGTATDVEVAPMLNSWILQGGHR